MPRKSQAKRLAETVHTIGAYETAGIGGGALSFMRDMSRAMKLGKYPTKRQREWLDKLIEEGVPEPKGNAGLIETMRKALAIFRENGKEWEAGVMSDFIHRENKDWGFSEKQVALRQKLIDLSVKVGDGSHWMTPTESQRRDLKLATGVYKGYSPFWRNERPALRNAVTRVESFLAGAGSIEEYDYNKLMKSLSAKIRVAKDPRFSTGDAGFLFLRDQGGKTLVLCATDMYITEKGEMVNDWVMPSGELKTLQQDRVAKR